jgi:predicted ATP-dependent serine protease
MSHDNPTTQAISPDFQAWLNKQGDLSELEFEEREPDLIEGVVPAGNIIFLTGHPKGGKSLVVQHWAHSVATGNDWQGHQTEQGTVLYLNPDGEHARYLAERIKAIEKYSGVAVDYKTRLRYRDSFNFSLEEDRENILEGIVFANLRMVIIDTIAAATPGKDLNSAKDISEIAEFAKEVTKRSNGKTTVVIVAHSPKGRTQAISGSTQLQAMASITYSMKKDWSSSGETYHLQTVESRHSSGRFEMRFNSKTVQLSDESETIVLVSTSQASSESEKKTNRLRAAIVDLPQGEWIPQAPLVKQLMAECSIGDSTARRWLEDGVKTGLLLIMGKNETKQFLIPTPHQSPTVPIGDPSLSPPSPTLLRVGNGEEEELF